MSQKTIYQSVSASGIGLHTGRHCTLSIHPAAANNGIVFMRSDLSSQRNLVPARWPYVGKTELAVTLRNEYGVEVKTVEHLMAALYAMEIDNAIIELNGPEVPILDGSSIEWIKLLRKAGANSQPYKRRKIRVVKPIVVDDGNRYLKLFPADELSIDVEIDFAETEIGRQRYKTKLNRKIILKELAAARTFGFLDHIEELQRNGLALGGSLSNAVVINHGRIVNKEGLRFRDEFVRHKILDCYGDLALAGAPLIAQIEAYKPGHMINQQVLKKLFDTRGAWSYEFDDSRLLKQKLRKRWTKPVLGVAK